MRVVIVSDFGSVNGGAAKVAIESARGLAEAGVEVVFACATAPVAGRLDHPGIIVETLGAPEIWAMPDRLAAARRGVWNEEARIWLAELIARQPASGTVVHLHQWTKAFSPAAMAAARASGRPVFVTVHDYFAFCPSGGYFDFRKAEPCDKRPMGAACIATNCDRTSFAHKLVRVARQWRSDRELQACRDLTFVHVTEFARRFAQPFLPAHARHVTVENMMEADWRDPVDVGRNAHALYLGRFTEEKAPDLLAAAAREAGMKVRFVGAGPLADRLRTINPDADLGGWVPPDQVFGEIARARVLVAPSLWFETGPMTVMEAAALGVPAIVSDRMGVADWVGSHRAGRIVAQGSRPALVEALREAATDQASAWGKNAHAAYWADPFTLRRHVDRLIEAYVSAMGARLAA